MEDRSHVVGRRTALLIGGSAIASLWAGCTSTGNGDTTVDLTYKNTGRLTGTFGGQRVNVTAALPDSRGTASGTVGGQPLDGRWRIDRNGSADQTVVPVSLTGRLAQESVVLEAVLRLHPSFLFDSGTVTGSAGGKSVEATASAASGASSSSVNVDGSFAGTVFSLDATIAGDLAGGLVRGTVAGQPVHLAAKDRSGAIHLTGSFGGPTELFVLAAGGLIYFLGGADA